MKRFILAVAVVLTGCGALDNKPAVLANEFESCKIYYEAAKPPVANVTVVRHKKKPKKEKNDGQQ
jgi:hypothetical protein